jgi:hypothetical protein
VAGAKGSLLSDLRNAVESVITNGQTLDEFKAQFNRITEGWAHRGGKDWRAAIVYGTNLRMAHAAGRYQYQLDPEVVKLQPYLQWIHSGSREPRPLHLALDRQVFRANELPIYPPEGYGCRCRTIALTERQLQQRGLTVSNLKRGDTVEVEIDGKTYRPVIEPSEGWSGEAPGQSSAQRRADIIENIRLRVPSPIRRHLDEEIRQINQRFAPAPPARTERTGAGRRAFIRQRREVFENPEAGYQPTFFDRASGGYVWVHENHNQGDSYQSELFVAKQLAKEGAVVKLISERAEPGIPTPDADVDGVVFDFKRLTSAIKNPLNAIQRVIGEARRQGASGVALHFDGFSFDSLVINRAINSVFIGDSSISRIILVIKGEKPVDLSREDWQNGKRL